MHATLTRFGVDLVKILTGKTCAEIECDTNLIYNMEYCSAISERREQ